MNKYNKLMSNSIVFMIGNFGSKFITFLMVPLYTHVLSTTEYGIIDLIMITISFLVPVITLELGQAIIRFSVGEENSKQNEIFQIAAFISLILFLLVLLSYPILLKMNLFEEYLFLFLTYLFLSCVNIFYTQFIRGIGLIKEYAFNGILMTLTTVISNLLLLVVFELGIKGYVFSMVISVIISNIYLFIVSHTFKRLSNFSLNFTYLKTVLFYCVPLIPNSLLLLLNNGATRYFIRIFVEISANGLFAVASRLPNILLLLTNIFTQAWQLSSFEEFESEDKGEFYTKTLSLYSSFLFIACSGILIILIPFMKFYVSNTFFLSWQFVPVLLFAAIYQSFNAFFGTIYTSAKATKGVFFTSLIGAFISLTMNFILIPKFGIQGAGIGTLLGYLTMSFLRFFDTKKYVRIDINLQQFFINNCVVIIQTILLYVLPNDFGPYIQVLLFIIILINNKHIIIVFKFYFYNLYKRIKH